MGSEFHQVFIYYIIISVFLRIPINIIGAMLFSLLYVLLLFMLLKIIINIIERQKERNPPLKYTAQSLPHRGSVGKFPEWCQTASDCTATLFIFIYRMPFLAPTLDNADPIFALTIFTGFYLHHVEVTNQGPKRTCRLYYTGKCWQNALK